MLRTMEQRVSRQEEMKDKLRQQNAPPYDDLLSVEEVATILHLHKQTARQLVLNEPGVHKFRTPGSRRAIIRVPRAVVDRLLLRSANP
jgi:hypothetical protein